MARWRALPDELDPRAAELVVHMRRCVDRAGLTLPALADRTGYSPTSWERFLNAHLLAPRRAIDALAEATDTSPVHLTTLWELAEQSWNRPESTPKDRTTTQLRVPPAALPVREVGGPTEGNSWGLAGYKGPSRAGGSRGSAAEAASVWVVSAGGGAGGVGGASASAGGASVGAGPGEGAAAGDVSARGGPGLTGGASGGVASGGAVSGGGVSTRAASTGLASGGAASGGAVSGGGAPGGGAPTGAASRGAAPTGSASPGSASMGSASPGPASMRAASMSAAPPGVVPPGVVPPGIASAGIAPTGAAPKGAAQRGSSVRSAPNSPTPSPSTPNTPDTTPPPESPAPRTPHRWLTFTLATLTALALATTAFLLTDSGPTRPPTATNSPSPSPSPHPALPPGVKCTGATCSGKDAETMGCADDLVTTAQSATVAGRRVEVRYSRTCGAAWGRILGAGPGDIVQVVAGKTRQRGDATLPGDTITYTPMVPVRTPTEAQACVLLTSGQRGCTS